MANYESMCRSNYFAVTDKTAFLDLIKRCTADGKVEISEQEIEGVNKVAFYCYGAIGIETEGANSFDVFVEELQKLIPDHEAVIIKEIGHEKFRYLIERGIIITNNSIDAFELDYIETCRCTSGIFRIQDTNGLLTYENPRKQILFAGIFCSPNRGYTCIFGYF